MVMDFPLDYLYKSDFNSPSSSLSNDPMSCQTASSKVGLYRELPFAEKEFASWMDGLEHHLITLPGWSDLLIYRDISLYDAGYYPLYCGFLAAFKSRYSSLDVVDTKGVNNERARYNGARLQALRYRLMNRLYLTFPHKKLPSLPDSRRALVLRAFPNKTAFPLLRALKDELNWNILFASWNHKLKKPVQELGIAYIHLKELLGRRFRFLRDKHRHEVSEILKGVDIQIPAKLLSECSGYELNYDSYQLFYNTCVQVRTFVDVYLEFITQFPADVLILFNEVSPPGRTMAKVAKIAKIPSVTVMHGLFIGYVYRSLATDRLIVWGKIPRDFWIEKGCAPERIKSVGAIGHEHWKTEIEGCTGLEKRSPRPTVLVIGQNPGLFISLQMHRATINAVMRSAEQLPHVDFIIKSHPGEAPEPYRIAIAKSNADNVALVTRGSIDTYLRNADLVITVFSTAGVEAMMLGRPVIVLNLSSEPPLAPYASAALLVAQPDKLSEGILRILEDRSYRNSLVELGRQFSKDYLGAMDGHSAERAAEAVVNTAQISLK